jgi:acyl CoA:acetate/3-ketoacid CoA transferase alpha subunit
MIASFIGENKAFEKMYITGELSLELTPQGTMAEKCAAEAAGVRFLYACRLRISRHKVMRLQGKGAVSPP